MPTTRGSQWSRDPLRDKLEDERAVDLEIADQLERAATLLRSRQMPRRELDDATRRPRTKSDPPAANRRIA